MEGERWLLVEEAGDRVCDQKDNYTVAIAARVGIHEAMDICRKKLNNSIIPLQVDRNAILTFSAWHFNTTGGACDSIWTPLSDEQTEGVFSNMNDGSETTFLPWGTAEPNGDQDENFVAIKKGVYNDVDEKRPRCSSCLLDRSLLLRLDGLCEESYIGQMLLIHTYFFRFCISNGQCSVFSWIQWVEEHLHQVRNTGIDTVAFFLSP